MSDLDTLIVTFQTQLSDVMETVVKTAMYEVTRLVETGLFEEVKRRNQEVESLRMQLQWAKRKLSHQVRKNVGKCGNCFVSDDLNLSHEGEEEGSQELQDDILSGLHATKEGDGIEKWPKNNILNIKSEATPEVREPPVACSPERDTQIMEKQEEIKAADVKEEEVTKLSCSSAHVGGWTVNADTGSVPHSEMTEEHAEQTEEYSQIGEVLRTVIKQDQQISPTYVFPEDQKDLNMTVEPSVDIDPSWASLTITAGRLQHDHTLRTERDDDLTKSWDALSQAEHEQSDSVTVKASACRHQLSSSDSSNPRLQNTDPPHVTIKQEVIVDSYGCDSDQRLEKKAVKRSGMASFSYSVKRNKVSSEVQKQNQDSHKATVQELMKLHSKAGTGLRLQAAIQHLQRPMKKNPQAHINNTTAAMSFAHSQVVNLHPPNRIPSTSKAGPSLTLSVQRVHPPGKQAMASNRTSTPWIKSSSQNQSTNTHHTNSLPHSDSHPIPRHPLRCGQCGKCFPHPSNLKAHLQTHTGERPFCCSLCGRSFTKLSNLKAHRRVHTGERPYCCLACGKRFTQKCNLKRHQRIHLEG